MSAIKLTHKIVAHIVSIARSSIKTPTQILEDLLKNPLFNSSLKTASSSANAFPIDEKTAYYSGFLSLTAKLSKAENSIKCRVGPGKGRILTKLSDYFKVGYYTVITDKNGKGNIYTRYVWHTDYTDFIEWFKATGLNTFLDDSTEVMALKRYPKEFLAGCIDATKTTAMTSVRLKLKSGPLTTSIAWNLSNELGIATSLVGNNLVELEGMGHTQLDRILKGLRP